MTIDQAFPSGDPADDDSLIGLFRIAMLKNGQGTDDHMPARLLSYDRFTNRAMVQAMIKLVTTDGRQISRATVASVPVVEIGGGGMALSFPMKPGDLGWIKASDRDISLFLQRYAESAPNTERIHSFQDAVFYPDYMRPPAIAGDEANSAVLGTVDGAVSLSVGPGIVRMRAGASSVTVTPAGVTIVGVLTINNIPYNAHVHSGVQSGISTSGPVVI